MSKLDKKTQLLIGISTAVVAHCRPCVQYQFKKAQEAGISQEEIKEAIQLARTIRNKGILNMDDFTKNILNIDNIETEQGKSSCCG